MKKRFSDEQIISILREAEAGVPARELCRKHAISDATFYTWRKKYGGMEVPEVKRLKSLEEENARLKKLLAEAMHSLPEEKRETVLLYYFFDMSEREIAKFCNLSRTTVQSRRTSSMKLLKRYLEEKAYDCTD